MERREDVCVLIPTYNEAASIGDIVEGFVDQGYTNVLVVDGHSTDGTREIAEEAGARVVVQSGSGRGAGKGQAVREGIEVIEAPYVLMLDGDDTYRPEDADEMLEPLLAGRAEHVIGNRFADMKPGAMPRLNRLGNRVINLAFRGIHRQDLVDILSGYRAFTLESARRLHLTAEGFAIETEFSVECVKHDITVEVVPITYAPRPDDSKTNLNPFRDGGRIALALYRLAKTNNPLFYFGAVGSTSILASVVVAAWLAYEWVVFNQSHEVISIVAGVGLLLGVQLIIFGVLADVIVSLHREQLRRLRQVEVRTDDDASSFGGARAPEGTGGSAVDGREETPGEGSRADDEDSPAEAPTGTDSLDD